jgi:hypothetical protein
MHWLDTIDEIRALRLELARLDPRGGMPVLPPAAATQAGIAAVERQLGRRLPPSYRAFLEVHDGWPQFFHGAGLFGVRHLSRGAYVDVVRTVLAGWEAPLPDGPPSRPSPCSALIPFGIDPKAETIFAWNPVSERGDGELEVVVWINEIGDRVDSLESLFNLVRDMLEADLSARGAAQTRRRAAVDAPKIDRALQGAPVRAA